MATRKEKLAKNAKKIFWIRACTGIRILNVVFSLFYIHRGVSLQEIFLLGIAWSFAHFFSEIPSSYLADRWGRKKTIVAGTLFNLLYWLIYFYSDTFTGFFIGSMSYGVSTALFSGTDEALLYDSAKELGQKDKARQLGTYFAADRLFKIVAPLLAVWIAHDLSELQFQALILIDIIGSLVAMIIALTLVEANHAMDLEKKEAGIMRDALKLFRKNRMLLNNMTSHTLVFLASLMLWHYFQVMYYDLGVSLLTLGIGWSGFSLLAFISHTWLSHRIRIQHVGQKIDLFKQVQLALLLVTIALYYTPTPAVLMFAGFVLYKVSVAVTKPLYARHLHTHFSSFNRATSISLSNVMRSLLDTPVSLLSAWLIAYGVIYPYYLCAGIMLVAIAFFPLKRKA